MRKKNKEGTKQKKSLAKRIKILLFIIGLTVIFGLIGYAGILFGGKLVVDEEKLILDLTTTIETSDGEVIGKLYNENRSFVDIEQVPKHVKNAFIAVEDVRFYEHAGIDFRSVMRAVYRDIIAMSKVEGASTITQQLAKNLFLYNDKTWTRKAKEAMAAIYMERTMPKDRILELYVNEIYYGAGIYGIETASNYFFSKSVGELTIAEGALLAGLAKAPNGYSPINHPEKALNRRDTVLQSMENAGMLSTEKRVQEQGKTLGLNLNKREPNPWADSYIDLVMKEAADKHQLSINELKRGGYRIVVNMDESAQKIAYNQFQNDAYFSGNTDGAEGAFVMMDQKSGKIVSAIGGRNYQLGNLNRVTVSRQPGSTMKPIAVYGPAMMQDEKYTPYSLIPDQAMDGYSVANVNNEYDGSVSIYNAIKNSKNAPAVWLLDQIGINYAKDYLSKMDIHIEDDGLALALGGLTNGLTPLQMMESFRSFVHSGEFIESYAIDRLYDRDSEIIFESSPETMDVFSPQVAWNMTEILMDTVESGTASPGDYPKALAGKTGSTQHPYAEGQVKDAWFVGYTPQYVTALWMGYDISDKDHYLTAGSEYPTRLTKAILTEMDKQESLTESFTKPHHVKSLPKPINLPKITDLKANYLFGGISLVKGKLSWKGSEDNRIVYRIYREEDGIDKRVGEVEGKTEFVIDHALFQSNRYYIVPYDPLSRIEGERSNTVELSW
ncbi:penicillin-binding protein [Virgibacillus profundi]|uniref:Penicillin-binding protein n=1 Tax=Virgibacillus profundi TaxID=2024555 RepID=A0A2A2IC21_9BACI|nr:PBP1A family penicillin-binding protein [Virgibacillus profundi]PAV29279.1 penicillin-binding protein [Virgibacillus profundi]PXY53448.1 penicillin-binding protein [Virgibacillus profundi]